jgi:hypothetical protein
VTDPSSLTAHELPPITHISTLSLPPPDATRSSLNLSQTALAHSLLSQCHPPPPPTHQQGPTRPEAEGACTIVHIARSDMLSLLNIALATPSSPSPTRKRRIRTRRLIPRMASCSLDSVSFQQKRMHADVSSFDPRITQTPRCMNIDPVAPRASHSVIKLGVKEATRPVRRACSPEEVE